MMLQLFPSGSILSYFIFLLKLLKNSFNWRKVALQYCISFAVQQHESVIIIYIYVYIPLPSWSSLPTPFPSSRSSQSTGWAPCGFKLSLGKGWKLRSWPFLFITASSIRGLKYFKHFHTLLVDIKLANFCYVFFDPANLLLGRSAYKLHNNVWGRMSFVASSCNSQKGNNLEISPNC